MRIKIELASFSPQTLNPYFFNYEYVISFHSVGAATGNSKVDKLAHRIDFELNQLKSFKRITRTMKQPAYVIFILNSGEWMIF